MSYGFLFIAAVAVRPAGCQRVLPHEIRHAARLAHGVVQMAHGRGQIVQPQLFQQRTDAALGEPALVAAVSAEPDGVSGKEILVIDEIHHVSPGMAGDKEALNFNAVDIHDLTVPQQHLFVVDGHLRQLVHIEKNTPFVGNVAYSQREFSYDNSLMELVRHTVEFIKRKPYGNKLLIKVKDEVKLVIDATSEYEPCDRQKIIEQNKKNTVRHAYFREYLALQRLCLLILQHQKHQIGAEARQIYGILFDGAWLWEEYVNSLIEDVFYHPMNKGGKGAQRLFDGNVGLIYPDFISRNSEMRIIADAKYKPIDNIGNRDYLQVLAYMFRFDAKAGYYLYPEAEGSDDLKLWLNRGSTYGCRQDLCAKLFAGSG